VCDDDDSDVDDTILRSSASLKQFYLRFIALFCVRLNNRLYTVTKNDKIIYVCAYLYDRKHDANGPIRNLFGSLQQQCSALLLYMM